MSSPYDHHHSSDSRPGVIGSVLIAAFAYLPLSWGPAWVVAALSHNNALVPALVAWVLGHVAWWYLCAWRLCIKRAWWHAGQRGRASIDAYAQYEESLGIPPRQYTFRDMVTTRNFHVPEHARPKKHWDPKLKDWVLNAAQDFDIDSTASDVPTPEQQAEWGHSRPVRNAMWKNER